VGAGTVLPEVICEYFWERFGDHEGKLSRVRAFAALMQSEPVGPVWRPAPGSSVGSSGTGSGPLTCSPGVLVADGDLALGRVYPDDGALLDVAGQQRAPDAGLHVARDEAAKRRSPLHGIESLLRDEPPGVLGEFQRL
jgi:hypothetical protein